MKQALNLRQQLSINLRYCYSSRRTTQNMSATRNSPSIGLNLRALPLSAVTVSLHYLPRCLHSIVRCGKTPTTVTWSASTKICCHVIVTQQRPLQNNLLPSFATYLCRQGADMSELQAHNCMLSKLVNLTLFQCECHIGKRTVIPLQGLTQIIRIKFLISRFPEIFAS